MALRKFEEMDVLKKQMAIALTVALLSFPLSSNLALAETLPTTDSTVVATTTDNNTATTTTTATGTDQTQTGTSTTQDQSSTNTQDPSTTTSQDQTTTTTSQDQTTTGTQNQTTTDTQTSGTDSQTPVVDDNGTQVEASSLPQWLDDLIGKLQLALTFDPVKKAKILEHQALEDLARANDMEKTTDTDSTKVEKVLTSYSDKITKAQEYLEKVKDPTTEDSQKLQQALANVHTNNVTVLGNLLEKLPPQAAEKIALNVVRAMEKAVAKMEKRENKKGDDDEDNKTTTDTTATDTTTTTDTTATTTADQTQTTATVSAVTADASTTQVQEEAKNALEKFKKELGFAQGEANKSAIAKEREKGQQGQMQRSDNQGQAKGQQEHASKSDKGDKGKGGK